MKKLAKLKSAKALNKKEQKVIIGGKAPVCDYPLVACYCPEMGGWSCAPQGQCD